jgi:uncharacterized protein DUF3592
MEQPLLVVLVVVGIVIYIIGRDWIEERRTRNYLLTEAEVVEVVQIVIPGFGRSGQGPRYRWKVKYTYKDRRGAMFYGESGLLITGDPTGGVQGATVAIKYDPENPGRSVLV